MIRVFAAVMAFSFLACANAGPTPAPKPPVLASILGRSSSGPSSAPVSMAPPLGWYVAWRCTTDLETIAFGKRYPAYHFEKDGWTSISASGVVAHRQARLIASTEYSLSKGLGAWKAKFELGQARWMVDGFVRVDSPGWSPTERSELLSPAEGLETLHGTTWLQETSGPSNEADSAHASEILATTMSESSSRIEHCLLRPVTEVQGSAYDFYVGFARDPLRCAEAEACCQALQGADGSTAARDVCSHHRDLDPQFCSYWIERTIDHKKPPIPAVCVTEVEKVRARALSAHP